MHPKVRRSISIFAAMYLCACAALPASSQGKPESRVITATQIFEQMQVQMRKEKASWLLRPNEN